MRSYAEAVSATDVRDLVIRECGRAHTPKHLREQVVALIRKVVGFDGFNFTLTDPATRVGTSPLADVPALPWSRLPELILWRYQSPGQRWDRDADGPAWSLCGEGTPQDAPLWTHVQRDLGVTDTATCVFADRFGAWGFLDLWRTGGTFTRADVAFLASLAPAVTAGLRAALARTFTDTDSPSPPTGAAVVLLDDSLSVRAQTSAAAAALLRLNPPDEPIPPVPAAAYNVSAALLAAEAGLPIGPAWGRLHLGGGRWVTVRADRIATDIAVTIDASSAAERLDLLARVHALSLRETEVLGLLGAGLDTRAIAHALVVSDHTANDHVKAVLAKTGAATRQVLLARALGPAGS